jgi:hypothetical protein
LVRGAGTFDPEASTPAQSGGDALSLVDQVKLSLQAAVRRALLFTAFYFTKRPSRIKQARG